MLNRVMKTSARYAIGGRLQRDCRADATGDAKRDASARLLISAIFRYCRRDAGVMLMRILSARCRAMLARKMLRDASTMNPAHDIATLSA
jgi:hypothetical protein